MFTNAATVEAVRLWQIGALPSWDLDRQLGAGTYALVDAINNETGHQWSAAQIAEELDRRRGGGGGAASSPGSPSVLAWLRAHWVVVALVILALVLFGRKGAK